MRYRNLTEKWVSGSPDLPNGVSISILGTGTYIVGFTVSYVVTSEHTPAMISVEEEKEVMTADKTTMSITLSTSAGANLGVTKSVAASIGLQYDKLVEIENKKLDKARTAFHMGKTRDWKILYRGSLHATMAVLWTDGRGDFDSQHINASVSYVRKYVADKMMRGSVDGVTREVQNQQDHLDSHFRSRSGLLRPRGESKLYYMNFERDLGYVKDWKEDAASYNGNTAMAHIFIS